MIIAMLMLASRNAGPGIPDNPEQTDRFKKRRAGTDALP